MMPTASIVFKKRFLKSLNEINFSISYNPAIKNIIIHIIYNTIIGTAFVLMREEEGNSKDLKKKVKKKEKNKRSKSPLNIIIFLKL